MTTGEIISIILLGLLLILNAWIAMRVRALQRASHVRREHGVKGELLEIKTLVQELQARADQPLEAPDVPVSEPATEPAPQPTNSDPGKESIEPVEAQLAEIEALANRHAADRDGAVKSLARSLADRCRDLHQLVGLDDFSSSQMEQIIACLFDRPPTPGWQVTGEAGSQLRSLATRLEEAKPEIVRRLKDRGIEPIYPIVNVETFDPDQHLDAGGSPGTTTDPRQNHVIVEVLRPGIRKQGKVVFQAKVFRLECEEVPVKVLSSEDLPEPKKRGDVGW